ncbi:MAG: hydroxyacylglutathione hydrolase [Gammaproteobacteria bacterium]|nr:hydroxyacylglutathione hydrolase [Gammaproteobacteria bacterium]
MLTVQTVTAFEDNYIWLIRHQDQPQVVIVDPGDAAPVITAITAQSLEPAAILITHHHQDHVGGIDDLLARWPMPVYGPAGESIPHISQPLAEADHVHIEALSADFQVLHVPGHTAGHIAYYHPASDTDEHGMIFVGDTLFAGGCGRLFEGTPTQMYDSLSQIATLPDDTQVYCAHEYTEDNLVFARIAEPDNSALQTRQHTVQQQREQGQATVPSLLGTEKATNPFLRCGQANIIRAAEGFSGRKLHTGAEVFAAVRHWKDTLD